MQHRARTLAPEHPMLLAPLANVERSTGLPLRFAFLALHTCADRDGRFPWLPDVLKQRVLPGELEVDFEEVLHHLAACGFVVHYCATRALRGHATPRVAQTDHFGCIVSWSSTQVINGRESESGCPGPAENGSRMVAHQGTFHKSTRSTTKAAEEEKRKDTKTGDPDPTEPKLFDVLEADRHASKAPRARGGFSAKVQAFIELWNEEVKGSRLPACLAATGQRLRDIELALRVEPNLEVWRGAMRALLAYPHACGENDRGWRADIGFLVQPSQRSKWLEKGYASAGSTGSSGATSVQDLLGEMDAEDDERKAFERWLGSLVNLPPGYRGPDPRMVGSLSPAQVARAERELKTWWRENGRRA